MNVSAEMNTEHKEIQEEENDENTPTHSCNLRQSPQKRRLKLRRHKQKKRRTLKDKNQCNNPT